MVYDALFAPNVVLMLGRRRRRRVNFETTLGQGNVFVEWVAICGGSVCQLIVIIASSQYIGRLLMARYSQPFPATAAKTVVLKEPYLKFHSSRKKRSEHFTVASLTVYPSTNLGVTSRWVLLNHQRAGLVVHEPWRPKLMA